MANTVKLSSKHQIAIPRDVRRQLKLKAGDKLLVEVRHGTIELWPLPKNFTEYMLGLHKEVWEGVDVRAYIREEHKGWR